MNMDMKKKIFWSVIISISVIIVLLLVAIIILNSKKETRPYNGTVTNKNNTTNTTEEPDNEVDNSTENTITDDRKDIEGEITYETTSDGGTIPIPPTFKYVEGDSQTGAVIEDEDGNQFVWVPVSDYNSYHRQYFLNNGEVMEGGSEFILTILGAMAQQESANMSKRVKFGKDITAQKGRVPNIVFGYDKIPNERYTLQINEEEAKIVKEIFESYVYKGIGTTKIAWDLNDRGIRTKKTKSKWVQTSIVRMLKNPIYTGRVTNKKSEVTDFITGTRKDLPEEEWIVVERPEMRIISDELFNRAQEILAQRSNEFKLNSKREKTEYVFSTLIYCKHCGYSFRRIKRKYKADGPEYIRWVCSGRNSMGVNHCPNTTVIDEEELLSAIKIYLNSIISNKKNFMKAVEKEFEKITKLRENNERNEINVVGAAGCGNRM